ncbi:MAG: hypothetical protein ACRDH6_02530 [Actinomycetota bacterium]
MAARLPRKPARSRFEFRLDFALDVDETPAVRDDRGDVSWDRDHLAESIAMHPGLCFLDRRLLARSPQPRR